MTCPTPSEDEMNALIDKVNLLLANVTKTQECDAECQKKQILDSLKDDFVESTDNYTTCESRYKASEKAYIIQKYGIDYYNKKQDEEEKARFKSQIEAQFKLFLGKLNETNATLKTLQNDFNHFKLIKDLYDNTGANKTLNDVFGITISRFEGLRTMETINRDAAFYYEKNQTGKFINRILYILFYLIAIIMIIFMDTTIIKFIVAIVILQLLGVIKYILIFLGNIISYLNPPNPFQN